MTALQVHNLQTLACVCLSVCLSVCLCASACVPLWLRMLEVKEQPVCSPTHMQTHLR